ncbi:hypothetical protein LINPERPRIM_LOCUS5102 [Linum perenne]
MIEQESKLAVKAATNLPWSSLMIPHAETALNGRGAEEVMVVGAEKDFPVRWNGRASLDKLIASWEIFDARVLSYILGFVDSSIVVSLRSFPTSTAVWLHLHATYSHVSASRLFDLEFALANLSQGDLDVNHYYLAANNLCTEIDLLSTSMLSTAADLRFKSSVAVLAHSNS